MRLESDQPKLAFKRRRSWLTGTYRLISRIVRIHSSLDILILPQAKQYAHGGISIRTVNVESLECIRRSRIVVI